MFRDMRRKKQQLSREETEALLTRGTTGILGLMGDGDYPYAVPVNYAYLNGKIYFHGAKTGHKAEAMRGCDKVSFCVVGRDEVLPEKLTTLYQSAIVFGRVRMLEDEGEIVEAARAFGLRYSDDLAAIDEEISRELKILGMYEITVEHLSGKESRELARART